MIGRFAIALYLWISLVPSLGAQTPDSETDEPEKSVYVHVEVSPTGNVNFEVMPTYDQDRPTSLMDTVPRVLDCQWTELHRSKYSLSGICRGWAHTRRWIRDR